MRHTVRTLPGNSSGCQGRADQNLAYGGQRHRQRRDAHADEHRRTHRIRGGLATNSYRFARLLARLGRDRDEGQHCRLPGIGEVGQIVGHPVSGHRLLLQVGHPATPGGEPVDASSALLIMTLGAARGDTVEVSGDDQSDVDKIAALVEQDLDA